MREVLIGTPCGAGGRGAPLDVPAQGKAPVAASWSCRWAVLARAQIDEYQEIPLELHPQLRLEVHDWGGAQTEDRSAHGEIFQGTGLARQEVSVAAQ
jgi:hypothetical protein